MEEAILFDNLGMSAGQRVRVVAGSLAGCAGRVNWVGSSHDGRVWIGFRIKEVPAGAAALDLLRGSSTVLESTYVDVIPRVRAEAPARTN